MFAAGHWNRSLAGAALVLGALGVADALWLGLGLWPAHLYGQQAPLVSSAARDPEPAATVVAAKAPKDAGGPSGSADTSAAAAAPGAGETGSSPAPPASAMAAAAGAGDTGPGEAPPASAVPSGPPAGVIYFNVGSSVLGTDGRTRVRALAERHRGARFLPVGHTDRQGNEGYNELLGLQRAVQVAMLLSAYGVPKDRILDPVSRGSGQPTNKRPTPAARSRNRRVEVFVLP